MDRVWPATSQRDLPDDPPKPSRDFSGGTRADFKVFGLEVPVSSALFGDFDQVYDMCYCHKNCDSAENYFKLGNLQLSRSIAIASKTKPVKDDKTLLTIML